MRTDPQLHKCNTVWISALDSVLTDSDSVHSWSGSPSSLPELPASDNSFVSAMDEDRVVHVEQEIAVMQAGRVETWAKIDQLTAVVAQLLLALPLPTEPIKWDVSPIQLCPDNFWDEQAKIIWAMSYVKAGWVSKWTARIFRWEEQPENSDSSTFWCPTDSCRNETGIHWNETRVLEFLQE